MNLQMILMTGSLCLSAGLLVLFLTNRYRERRTMERLRRMLEDAADGSFLQKKYDETYLSALEMQMSRYLKKNESVLKKINQNQEKISSLISDISHQTKTPIANILIYTELLLEKELPKEVRDCAEQIHGQTGKLQFLINVLIRSSRLENGIIRLEPLSQSVAHMIEEAAEQAKEKALARQIEIRLPSQKSLEECGGEAYFDKKWTSEALYNLLDNAVKYTCEGDCVEIRVTAYELFLRIDVNDHGPGIPEEEQAKIFGRFFRGENARDREGVGIGLYLANQIVNGEGGYLKVESRENGGTRFSMFLLRE